MNKRLITSWLHVFMVIALFAIFYAAFEGISFYSGGNFRLAGIAAGVIVILVLLMFIIPQQLKGRDGDFKKMIILERYFVLILAPLSLVLAAFPISHFLNIQRNEPLVIQQFTCAIDSAKFLFDDYEKYATNRIQQYENTLRRQSKMAQENKIKALQLQLLSANYDTLRTSALEWIETSAQKPSTLNVFLLGNIEGIKKAIDSWNIQLHELSLKQLSDEPKGCEAFSNPSKNTTAATTLLDNLAQQYRQRYPFSLQDLLVMLILWILLMLPYFFQQRHSKSTKRLFGKEERKNSNSFFMGNKGTKRQSFRFKLNNKQ